MQSACQDDSTTLTGLYFGQTPPANVPQLFAPPGLQSNNHWLWHGSLAFSVDGTTCFLDVEFLNATPSGPRIQQMTLANNSWGIMKPADFSGEYTAAGMSFNQNGKTAYWVSDRPGGALWKSNRTNNSWSAPEPITFPDPSGMSVGRRVSVSVTGRIYTHFFSDEGGHIYTMDPENKQFSAPHKMSDSINSRGMDINAFVDPEEQYLVFESARPGGKGQSDLYISFRKQDETWTTARNMGYSINTESSETSPYISPDKRFLFFLSDRDGSRNLYWVSTSLIDSLKQAILAIPENPDQRQERAIHAEDLNAIPENTQTPSQQEKPSGVSQMISDFMGNKNAPKKSDENTESKKDAFPPAKINSNPLSIDTNSLNIPEMVFVAGGTFKMGEKIGGSDKRPPHTVKIDDFFIGKYEVTQAQWLSVMGNDGHVNYFDSCSDCPVERVSWNNVMDYIVRLNALTGKKYRLPTEAEWEFAARGGNKSSSYKYSGSDNSYNVAWRNGNANNTTHSVGLKTPNELGLYDMSGNVWEWCSDGYSATYYSISPKVNPTGPLMSTERVLRGGSWFQDSFGLNVTDRKSLDPEWRLGFVGFRLCR